MIIFEVLLSFILFAMFAVSHSFLASNKIKKILVDKIGEKIAFYRLFYNLSSVIFFIAFYVLSPKPNITVYDLQFPYDIITFALQVLSLIGVIWAARFTNLKEFIGIAQVERYLINTYKIDDLDERQTLTTKGAFKFVRHPVYLFCILFLGLRPTMSLFYLIMYVCACIYFYIGSIYEERKLVEKFCDEYIEYQKKVPRMIPFPKSFLRRFGTKMDS